MKATINGQISAVMELKSGVSKTGKEWKSQDYVLTEEDGTTLTFNVFGDRIDQYQLTVGAQVSVTLEVKAREWNGRYFTQVTCLQCYRQNQAPAIQAPQTQQPTPMEQHKEQIKQEASADVDNLPF